ncbi:MAG: GNAT family N-acetyltransferase [Ideonella sp.]|nr:GNAT family N-acetyltransferase [Ideonella sp.]MCC7457827.1 GNAT family N-acetyltransferase [Nitrospira sp.]
MPDSIHHASGPQGPSDPVALARSPTWVPIRSLAPRHRDRILAHLLRLPERDRYLRFGYMASDLQITRYVDELDFERDEVLGIFNRRLRLLGLAHLAYVDSHDGLPATRAEFGVSVAANARGRGYGQRLFDLAVLHARNRGVQTLVIHALSENTTMLRIARKAGAEVVREGGEAQAVLRMPADSFQSHVEQLVEDSAAEWDYRFKQQARQMSRLLAVLSGSNPTTDGPRAPPD